MTIKEQMEQQMAATWDDIDTFLESFEGSSFDTETYWSSDWAYGKQKLFKLFGDKLKIEREVELVLSKREVERAVEAMFSDLKEKETLSYTEALMLAGAFSNLSSEEVIENRLEEARVWYGVKLGKGMKLSRALGRLINDGKKRDQFQTEFSKLLQSFKATGTLVISIDPIDILTMSYSPDNEWRSCHNIVSGEFRGGAITYLFDPSTIVAYVYRRTAESEYMPGVELPNKIWRQIGYVSRDLENMVLSTHYPSHNKNNEGTLIKLIAEELAGKDVLHTQVSSDDLSVFMSDHSELHYNDISEGLTGSGRVIHLGDSFDSVDSLREAYEGYAQEDLGFDVGVSETPAADGGILQYADEITGY